MADNVTFQSSTLASPEAGFVASTDDCGASGHIQRIKLAYSADGVATHVLADANGLQVQGTVAATQSGTWNVGTVTTVSTVTAVTTITNAVAVTDNSGSLTVDAPVGTPVFVRLSDGSSAITTLPVSLASVPSHAVTNAGTFAVQAAQSGTWTVTGTGGTFPVTDSGGSLTVDNAGTFAVQAEHESNSLRVGGTATTVLRAAIAVSSSGANQIVAADATKKIRVIKYKLSANGAVNAKWQSASTDLTGLAYLPQYGVDSGAWCVGGHFETSANQALNLNLSGAVAVGGYVVYVLV